MQDMSVEKSNRVTASLRRPQVFSEVLGQDFVVATLQASIDKGKIANAYLFSGPRGCGKTSCARILAKALNCEKGLTSSPCGTCDSCKAIQAGSSFDVIEIDGASNTGVNDVRKIKDEVLFPPSSSRYKIYIIDEVHMLSTSAFNALLKTIEEPPEYVVFIFATTELHKVPATIKSRCQQFNFRLMSVEQLKDALSCACVDMGIKADDEGLYWIAKEGKGSMRDSYTLFDQVESFSQGEITMQKIQEKLGLVSLDSINSIFSYCVAKDVKAAISTFNDILESGVSIEQFITDSASYLRAVLFLKEGIEKESLLGYNKERLSKEVLQGWNANQLELAFDIILKLYKDIRFSIDPRFETELAIARIASLQDYIAPQELKLAFDAAKNMLKSMAEDGASIGANMRGGGVGAREGEKKNYWQHNESALASQKKKSVAYKDESVKDGFSEEVVEENNVPTSKPSVSSPKVSTIEDIRALIIQKTEKDNGMLSLTLQRSSNWKEEEGLLVIYGESSFDVSMLKNNLPLLSSYVNTSFVRSLKIEVLKKGSVPPNAPPSSFVNHAIEKDGLQEAKAKIDAKEVLHTKAQYNEGAIGYDDNKKYENDKEGMPMLVQKVIDVFKGSLIEQRVAKS